ncbi:MAG: hypothetical protein LBE84_06035 [Planctomycetota bacterium]|jgi:hypothetical protein|nr:hypothetical protein [Planctomycetota bacterium]
MSDFIITCVYITLAADLAMAPINVLTVAMRRIRLSNITIVSLLTRRMMAIRPACLQALERRRVGLVQIARHHVDYVRCHESIGAPARGMLLLKSPA